MERKAGKFACLNANRAHGAGPSKVTLRHWQKLTINLSPVEGVVIDRLHVGKRARSPARGRQASFTRRLAISDIQDSNELAGS